jgi:hypothetical protein
MLARWRSEWQRRTRPSALRRVRRGARRAWSLRADWSKGVDGFRPEVVAHGGEDAGQFVDDLADEGGAVLGADGGGGVVGGDGFAERPGEGGVEAAGVGQAVELRLGREAAHLERVFDRGARAAEGEGAVGRAGDGDDAAVDRGGGGGVEREFAVEDRLAFFEGREVEVVVLRTARLIFQAVSPARKTWAEWVSIRVTSAPPWVAGSARKAMTSDWSSGTGISLRGRGIRGRAGRARTP